MEEKNHIEQTYEQRMYFFVPYQLMGIQKAIQSGHAALEYAYEFGHTPEYRKFIETDKTWIILNGGTTNSKRDVQTNERVGTLDKIQETLEEQDIPHSTFTEPDLGDVLTAVCFLADERVWNWKEYPSYEDWAYKYYGEVGVRYDDDGEEEQFRSTGSGLITENDVKQEYENLVGGKDNIILKELIYKKPLAL